MTKVRRYDNRSSLANIVRRGLLRALLPVECLVCSDEGEWLCPDCRESLPATRPITCVICAKAAEDGLCNHCRGVTKLDGAVSLFAYHHQGVQRLIKGVKFGGYTDAISFYLENFGEMIMARLEVKGAVLVPLPLSRERLQERGFNQSEVFCEQLARRYGLSVWNGLKRSRHTKAQAELGRKERLKNVKGAFRVVGGETAPKKIILVDDVITTGATLGEAARTLRKVGTEEIVALTLAHG
ncbi:MAG: ComF family protein [Candidatus Berkelbacteria bacterium]|nr:MAG: ComF family protein [Candidatus Berkelbacteria bacterium]QQG51714.1 MAG: ComF family protein [Candidatus Berkelbacteria bacterium]